MNAIQPGPAIADRLRQIIAEHLGLVSKDVMPGASLAVDLHADSMDRVDLTMAIEEEFGFEIPDEAAEQLVSVADVIAYVERRVREQG